MAREIPSNKETRPPTCNFLIQETAELLSWIWAFASVLHASNSRTLLCRTAYFGAQTPWENEISFSQKTPHPLLASVRIVMLTGGTLAGVVKTSHVKESYQ